MSRLVITTERRRQVIDCTDQVKQQVATAGLAEGLCHVFVSHTTAAVTTADLDPGTDLDTLDFFEALTPQRTWRHPHDPDHVPDHIWSSLVGPSLTIPVHQGQLALGEWQRVVLIEFNGPRQRTLTVTCTPV